MTLVICWAVFPLVLVALSLGCGLVLERVSGIRLHRALLVPAGLAVIVVVAQLATSSEATAPLATPAVVALALAGAALSLPWRRPTLDGWAALSAAGVFAAFAAPVVLSGRATFAGYIKLDDTAIWLALTDRVMELGRDLSGLASSTYEATLAATLGGGYPVGSFLPFGVGGQLISEDLAWLFQPYLAFLAAMTALGLYAIVSPAIASRPLRALAVFIASQPALLFGYALWGGIKEIAAAWTLVLLAALIPQAIRDTSRARGLIPLAVASAAFLSILSYGGVGWLVPLLVPALVAAVRMRGQIPALRLTGGFVLIAGLLSLPSLLSAGKFLGHASVSTLTLKGDLGNLIAPLSWLQFFGIWPVGDFRLRPGDLTATRLLIVVLVAAAALGLYRAWRRRAWELLAFVFAATLGAAVLCSFGSPWVDAKALATASPAFLIAGMVGAAAMFELGRRVPAGLIAAAIAAGVLWSNALAYHEVNLAPRDRLAELEQIGKRFAGDGPALMTEYESYGNMHFLRAADPEGASDVRRRLVPLRNGRPLDPEEFVDLDQFRLDGLLVYRTLVLRRSPVGSRPPSVYSLVSRQRYYDVWQRPDRPTPVIREHLPLGNETQPAAVPSCRQVLRLARLAGPGGRLAAVERPLVTVLLLSRTQHPPDWQIDPHDPGIVAPVTAGKIEANVSLPRTQSYEIWLRGLFKRELQVSVDDRVVASPRPELSHFGPYLPIGKASLGAGSHHLTLDYGGADLHPGSGGPPDPIGPLALAPDTTNNPLIYVPTTKARSLCGRRLDWIEALGS